MKDIEETQRKIELAERKYKQSLYKRSLKSFRIFPDFYQSTHG